ncbi:MAG: hypothetical protein K2M19_01530 [Muribaculaceae bacterium]|nr:hypothetical protein [Muribaculaceae bacterium]
MADNYLERRMEDYRAGHNSRPLAKTRRSAASLTFPAMRVAIIGVGSQGSVEAVRQLVATGCRVAFTVAAGQNGAHLAQNTGGRFYPCTADEMLARLASESDAPAAVVMAGDAPVAPELPEGTRLFSISGKISGGVSVEGSDPTAVARTLVSLMTAPPLPEQNILC